MKKSWLVGIVLVLLALLVGRTLYLRPSPQDALVMGVQPRDLATMRSAIGRGADVTQPIAANNPANISPGYTPLQLHLVNSPTPERLKVLLQRADLGVQSITGTMVDPDKRDGFIATRLYYLVLRANEWARPATKEMLQLLLSHGAAINAKAKYPAGMTPLVLARKDWLQPFLLEA